MEIAQPSKNLIFSRAIFVFGEEDEKMPRLQRANRGKKVAWLRLEQDVMAWITEKRNNGLAFHSMTSLPVSSRLLTTGANDS